LRGLIIKNAVIEEVRAKLLVDVHNIVEIGSLVVRRPLFDHIVEVVDERRFFGIKAADVAPFRDEVKFIEDGIGGSGWHVGGEEDN
jgi:hypothetical protein